MTCRNEKQQIHSILTQRNIHSVFQPIVDLRTRDFLGVEALARGPEGSKLFSPAVLFPMAARTGVIRELELLALETASASFAALGLSTKLFVNISPMSLMAPGALELAHTLLAGANVQAEDVILELSEQYQTDDFDELTVALERFKAKGFGIAVDDLGSGYAGLKTWSQLKPDFVKIDRHFISGIDSDPIKREFVRSILTMAREIKSRVIAEGVETPEEAHIIRELGVRYVQGYLFGRPATVPVVDPRIHHLAAMPVMRERALANRKTIGSLTQNFPSIDVNTRLADVVSIFKARSDISSLPVLHHNTPVGLISRQQILEIFSDRFGPELHSRKPVIQFMTEQPLVVEYNAALEDVSYLLTENGEQDLIQDFIIANQGQYHGVGKTSALLRAITEQQICNARYANPLTQLPGNVPINEQVNTLISQRTDFWAAYCDINGFKAFNDVYGYAMGDKAIMLLANILSDHVNNECDFIGHIGGDDFILLLRSAEATRICTDICDAFRQRARALYDTTARGHRGIWSQDRQGQRSFFPLMTLSIGMVKPDLDANLRADNISTLASEAKKEAKLLIDGGVYVSPERFPGCWRAVS